MNNINRKVKVGEINWGGQNFTTICKLSMRIFKYIKILSTSSLQKIVLLLNYAKLKLIW